MRRGTDAAPAPADSAATRPATAAGAYTPAPSPALVPSGTIAPATAAGPVVKFGAWVDSSSYPSEPAAQRAKVAMGLRLLADALQERLPLTGAQIMLTRAMADTVEMSDRTPIQAVNATQAAFFAVAYATRTTPGGARIEHQASGLQITKPLTQQADVVKKFFVTAREVMQDPTKGLSTEPPKGQPAPPPPPKS